MGRGVEAGGRGLTVSVAFSHDYFATCASSSFSLSFFFYNIICFCNGVA